MKKTKQQKQDKFLMDLTNPRKQAKTKGDRIPCDDEQKETHDHQQSKADWLKRKPSLLNLRKP